MYRFLITVAVLTSTLGADQSFAEKKIEGFNKITGLSLTVVKEAPLSDTSSFAILKDPKSNAFSSAIFFKNEDYAVVPSNTIPLVSAESWAKTQAPIMKMFVDLKNEEASKVYGEVPTFMKIHFGKDTKSKKVVIVDPQCPGCNQELHGSLKESYDKGESFTVCVVAAFGERSVDDVQSLISKDYGGDFTKFLKEFDDSKGKQVAGGNAERRADILSASSKVFANGIIEGVPFTFMKTE